MADILTPQVQADYRPVSPLTVNTSSASFGGASAEAASHVGKIVDKAGDELYSRALALQQLDQQAEATNAVGDYTDRVGERLEKFRTLEGKSAFDARPSFVDDINTVRDEVAKGLKSDYARRLFLQESRSIQSRTVLSASSHAGDQFKNYLVGTEQSNIHTATVNASLHPEDDAAFKQSLAKIDSSVQSLKSIKGWSDEQATDYANTQKSLAVLERAKNMARSDPLKAQQVLDAAVKDKLISGEDSGKASDFIRSHRNQITSRVESGSFLAGESMSFGRGKVSPDRLLAAISANESSGNYNAPHPPVTKGAYAGQHALGRYGIMQGNLAPWLKEAGMPSMTEQEFLADHAAQDKLAKFKLAQLQDKYGSANEAARHWFGLDPKGDGYTTGEAYLVKFNKALAKTASSSEVNGLAKTRANELVPDDKEFEQHFSLRVEADHNKMVHEQRQEEFERKQKIDEAILPAKDGKLVTSIDDITDPDVRDAWDKLDPRDKLRYQTQFSRNAKGDYAPTVENQREFNLWLGRLTDPEASEDDRRAALEKDYTSMPMPADQRRQLIALRAKVFSNSHKNPAVSHAMQVLGPMLNDAGVTKKSPDDYYLFVGTLHTIMDQRMKETTKPITDEDIKTIGAGLLRQQTVKGWLWNSSDNAFKAEVPEQEKNKIIEVYKEAKGIEPTEKMIQQIYAARQFNILYTSRGRK